VFYLNKVLIEEKLGDITSMMFPTILVINLEGNTVVSFSFYVIDVIFLPSFIFLYIKQEE